MSVVIIGNKPYEALDISSVLDSFDNNVRCNMTTVGRSNGNKHDTLALCSHVYKNLIKKPVNISKFKEMYSHAYLDEEIDKFFKKFDKSKYSKIYYANPSGGHNDFLEKIKCPHLFSMQPRTGYVAMMDNLSEGKKVFVTHFSVDEKEERKSYYVQPHHYETSVHYKEGEIKVIQWLHENGFVDASLCLLKDVDYPVFDASIILPTVESIKMILNHFKECDIEGASKEKILYLQGLYQIEQVGSVFKIKLKK